MCLATQCTHVWVTCAQACLLKMCVCVCVCVCVCAQEHLDDLCEGFLESNFDCRLDFAVEDALPNLVQWGMVRVSGHSYWAALLSIQDV